MSNLDTFCEAGRKDEGRIDGKSMGGMLSLPFFSTEARAPLSTNRQLPNELLLCGASSCATSVKPSAALCSERGFRGPATPDAPRSTNPPFSASAFPGACGWRPARPGLQCQMPYRGFPALRATRAHRSGGTSMALGGSQGGPISHTGPFPSTIVVGSPYAAPARADSLVVVSKRSNIA